jgi:hypothetical protein
MSDFRDYFLQLAAIFGVTCVAMACLLLLLIRRAIVNIYDPLAVQALMFLAPYLTGYILFPVFQQAMTPSYWLIVFFLATFLAVMSLIPVPRTAFTEVRLPAGYLRIILAVVVAIDVLSFCVNVLGSGGGIPLFSEAGSAGRFEATTNSRLLTWLSFGTNGTPVLIYALCEDRGIRRLAMGAFVLECLIMLLFAGKGAILQPVFFLLTCMFVARARGDDNLLRRYKSILRYGGIVLIAVVPIYLLLALRGTSLSDLPLMLGIRFFGGFDQLIPAALNDMAYDPAVQSDLHLNLLQYQFMPFFKSAFGINPTYSSMGQYVVAYVTGYVIEGPFTFPNSNLILETMFTSGNRLGYVFYVCELLIFYFVRRRALSRPVTPASLLALKVTVFNPMGMFLSGQEYFTTLVISAVILWGCYALWVLVRKEPGSAVAVSSAQGAPA